MDLLRALWTVPRRACRLFVERVYRQHLRPSELIGDQAGLQEEIRRDEEQMRLAAGRWERAAEVLPHYREPRLSELRKVLGEERRAWQRRQAQLRSQQAGLLEARQHLESVRQLAMDAYDQFSSALLRDRKQSGAADEDVRAVEAEIATQRKQLREHVQSALDDVNPLLESIDGVIGGISEHLEQLDESNRDIRWHRITRRGTSVLETDWSALLTTGASLLIGLTAREAKEGAASAEVGVLEPATTVEGQARRVKRRVSGTLSTLSVYQGTVTSTLVLLAALTGYGVRRVARWRGRPLARHIADRGRLDGFSRRMRLLFWNLLWATWPFQRSRAGCWQPQRPGISTTTPSACCSWCWPY